MTQILNFGLPAPIDVQIEGSNIQANHDIAEKIMTELHQVPGLADPAHPAAGSYPTLDVAVDRTRHCGAGFEKKDVASSVLNSLSRSFQITPMFFVNWKNSVNYNLVADAAACGSVDQGYQECLPIAGGTKGNQRFLRMLLR